MWRGVLGTRTGCSAGQPTECPTTCLGGTSSAGLRGHQLLEGTLQASSSLSVASTRAVLAGLWRPLRGQVLKQRPLMIQDRQAVLSPILGISTVSGFFFELDNSNCSEATCCQFPAALEKISEKPLFFALKAVWGKKQCGSHTRVTLQFYCF